MIKIYLCGPINGCNDDEAYIWRNWFKNNTKFNTKTYETIETSHGPETKEKIEQKFKFIDPMERDYRGIENENYREIVDLDKRDILSSDILVVMYTKPSIGTSMEIFFAWTNNIPIIIINESNNKLSPWLKYHSTTIVKTREQAVKKINNFFTK